MHAGTNSHKVKGDWNFLGWVWTKMGLVSLVIGLLKLTVSEEWTDGINWFFTYWFRFTGIKIWFKIFCVGMVKNWCGQYGHLTLKLTLSKKQADGMNWFFECMYKFRYAKSWFKDFWVSMVKNGHDHLVHETLKSAVS